MAERRTRDADIAVLEMGRWGVSLFLDGREVDGPHGGEVGGRGGRAGGGGG